MFRLLVTVGICCLASTHIEAQTSNSAYLSLSDGSIVLADFENCSSTQIIEPGRYVMYDIAEGDTDQFLYGIYNRILFRIDLDTKLVTELGTITSTSPYFTSSNSLVREREGTLLAVTEDNHGSLFRIDVSTLEATYLGSTGYASAGDLTFIEGELYLSAMNGNLVQVNISDPAASIRVGNMNNAGFSDIFGVVTVVTGEPCTGNIDYTMIATGGRSVRSVNTATGETQELCTNLLGRQSIYGAAEVSVQTICKMTLTLQEVDPVCAGEDFSVESTISPEIPFGEYTYEWYLEGSSNLLSTESTFTGAFTEDITLRCVITDTERVGEFKSVEANVSIQVDPAPVLDELPDVEMEEIFTFPEITGDNLPQSLQFYTQTSGQGDPFHPGDTITFSDEETYPLVFYVYAENELFCADEISFQVTLNPKAEVIEPEPDTTSEPTDSDEELIDPPLDIINDIPVSVPKFFTPNSDGYHDYWDVSTAQNIFLEGVYIFDRFGKLLRQLDPENPSWDGTYRGKNMPGTDYWFLISYRQDQIRQELRGHFTLKR